MNAISSTEEYQKLKATILKSQSGKDDGWVFKRFRILNGGLRK
jgi:hypothetical protein